MANAGLGDANIVRVKVNTDIVHPGPYGSHPSRAATHKGVDDGITWLGDDLQEMRKQRDRLDAVVKVSPFILGFMKARGVLARFLVDPAKWQTVSAQLALPVGRLIVGKYGRTHLAITQGILGPKAARAPLFNICLVSFAISLLARYQNGLVSGTEP